MLFEEVIHREIKKFKSKCEANNSQSKMMPLERNVINILGVKDPDMTRAKGDHSDKTWKKKKTLKCGA